MKTRNQSPWLWGLLFFLLGCGHFGLSERKVASLPRHVIIAVHGIGGNAETFGSLGEALKSHLEALNPNYQYEFYHFNYKKGIYDNTFDYAEQSLSDFMDGLFKNQALQAEDKITLVAHSQGGLISMIWYVDTLLADHFHQSGLRRQDLSRFAPYARQIDSIVTLGTPFWGSKLATSFSDPEKVMAKLGMFNPVEMEDMAFGSNTIYKFRRSTIALSEKPELKKLFKARLINIAGIFPKEETKLYYKNVQKEKWLNFLLDAIRKKSFDVGFGGDRYESDLAVLAPSSHLGFLYASDLEKTDSGQEINGESFHLADFFSHSEWILTESLHSPIKESRNVGMAFIPAYCVDLKVCDHPTYRYILWAVANCQASSGCLPQVEKDFHRAQDDLNAEDNRTNATLIPHLQGYEIELVLRLPDSKYDLEDPRFKSHPSVNYFVHKGPSGELDGGGAWEFSQAKFYQKSILIDRDPRGRLRNSPPLVEVQIAQDTEPLSKSVSWRDITFRESTHTDLRLHITGNLRPSALGKAQPEQYQELLRKGVDIPILVDLPGLKKRSLQVRVRPAFSSFVEVQMRYRDEFADSASRD